MEVSKKMKILNVLMILCIFVGLVSCDQPKVALKTSETASEIPKASEVTPPLEVEKIPIFITYHLDSLENVAQVDSFKTNTPQVAQEFILALNRIDAYRLKAGDKIVIPDTISENFLDYSPFPREFEMLDSIPKAVLISRRIQGFALYEKGKLLHWGPVSSGKQSTPTPAGLFYGNYKARTKTSTVNDAWILPYYFNFMNFEGVGVHQYSMPGFPASHACVRLRTEDAITIYNWADQWKLDPSGRRVEKNGTPFMVFGNYNFDGQVPWLDLAENPNANFLNAEEMETLRAYVTTYRKDSRNFATPGLPEELPVPPLSGPETIQ